MKRLLAIFTAKHQPDRDALSAYLDGQLAPDRTAALEAHVSSCDACTTTLEGMRSVRTMLRALPEAEPPRSFRLRPSDVEAPARRGIAAPPPSLMRAMPVLSAAAVIVFAIAVALDAGGTGSNDDESAGLTTMQRETAAYAESGADAAQDGERLPNGGPPADDGAAPPESAPGGAVEPQPASPEAPSAADATADEGQPDVAATTAGDADDEDGNNLALRIVEVAAAAVAIVAGGLALRAWRKRREGVA